MDNYIGWETTSSKSSQPTVSMSENLGLILRLPLTAHDFDIVLLRITKWPSVWPKSMLCLSAVPSCSHRREPLSFRKNRAAHVLVTRVKAFFN